VRVGGGETIPLYALEARRGGTCTVGKSRQAWVRSKMAAIKVGNFRGSVRGGGNRGVPNV